MNTFYAPLFTKSITHKSLTLFLVGLFILNTGRSQTAGNWSFTNTVTGLAGSSITVSNVSLGPSIVSGAYNGGTEYFGEGGWPSGALDPNAYIQFTLTANAGYYLVLNTINLVQRHSSTGTASGSGPNQWSIRSSLDNYSTDITSGSLTPAYITYPVSLPAAFQAIPSSVTFRVYGYDATVTSGGLSRFVYDNISVQGQAMPGILAQQSIDLTAKSAGPGTIALQWQAEGFSTGTDFTLQRSTDGVHFNPVFQQQNSGADDTRFQYQDAASAAALFYRVAALQPDGATYLSPTVAIKQETSTSTQIKGVVAQGVSVKTFLHIEQTGSFQLSIGSSDGKVLLRQMLQANAGDPVADIAFGSYPHGVYVLTLAGNGQSNSRQFVY